QLRGGTEGRDGDRRFARQGRKRRREDQLMGLDALWSAATGMYAQQTALDTISNNLSNVNTTGFKSGRTAFSDLLYTELTPQQAAKQGGQEGLGTQVSAVQTQMGQGNLQTTGNA